MTNTTTKGTRGGSNTFLSMAESAEYVGLSYQVFMRNWRRLGIRGHQLVPGGKLRFRVRDLEAFLERDVVNQ